MRGGKLEMDEVEWEKVLADVDVDLGSAEKEGRGGKLGKVK